jgi:hypothetical protein
MTFQASPPLPRVRVPFATAARFEYAEDAFSPPCMWMAQSKMENRRGVVPNTVLHPFQARVARKSRTAV